MKLSPIQMMGPDFSAQLPLLAVRLLITEDLLRRVWHELPELRDTDLSSAIHTTITFPNDQLVEGAR